MKVFQLLALCIFLTSAAVASAVDGDPVLWYEITYDRGDTTETFVGTSKYDSSVLASCLFGKDLVMLSNLRIYGTKEGGPIKWQSARAGQAVFLRPDKILYFYALPSDPADNSK